MLSMGILVGLFLVLSVFLLSECYEVPIFTLFCVPHLEEISPRLRNVRK